MTNSYGYYVGNILGTYKFSFYACDTTASTNRGQLAQASTYVQTVNASTTVDWNNGNIQEINTLSCDSAKTITMSNVHDGAAYTLLLSGTAAHSGLSLFSSGALVFNAIDAAKLNEAHFAS